MVHIFCGAVIVSGIPMLVIQMMLIPLCGAVIVSRILCVGVSGIYLHFGRA
jgi:hypothetical protein